MGNGNGNGGGRLRIGERASETFAKMQGSQAWTSIFRPGSIFRKCRRRIAEKKTNLQKDKM